MPNFACNVRAGHHCPSRRYRLRTMRAEKAATRGYAGAAARSAKNSVIAAVSSENAQRSVILPLRMCMISAVR